MTFTNKVVIITGAANGIGKAVALAYAEKGANVVIADINEEGKAVAEEICGQFIKTDVRSEEDIISLMETTYTKFGSIDILINNAGKSPFKPLQELTIDEWDDTINTNLRSVFLASRHAAKYMKHGGRIVNIASTRAFMSEPHSEAYAATKGGIVALTHALAASLSENTITVNCISPGWIETKHYDELKPSDHEQHFSRRVGKPIDIARACLYLTADDNDFVTGTNLTVDGGMTRKMIYEE